MPRNSGCSRSSGATETFAEYRTCIGHAAAQQHGIADAKRRAGFRAVAAGRIEIDVEALYRVELEFVLEVHVVDARLNFERSGFDANAALDVMRGLGLQPEVTGKRV